MHPTPDELSRILTNFPLAATHIIDTLRNSGRLGSDNNSAEGPSYPEGSLARRPKVKPCMVKPEQRVDWNDEDNEVEDILEDEDDIPGPSNVNIADILLRYCRNVRLMWVKFNSKDTKESEWCARF